MTIHEIEKKIDSIKQKFDSVNQSEQAALVEELKELNEVLFKAAYNLEPWEPK